MSTPIDLSIYALHQAYQNGELTPEQVVDYIDEQCARYDDNPIWIQRLSRAALTPYLTALQGKSPAELPLYGIPFAIKDNIDLAGIPTTAACAEYAYTPSESAFVVQRLIEAGAIPIGKTNLDQFATGLVGTRSPYGAVHNAFHPDYIAGGSSSGSAVATALGLVSFALGTDTAGSGRVPAAFNNLVGLKPSRGLWSASGVVPACRTLDCVTVFALNPDDAASVHDVAAQFDASDAYAREAYTTGVTRATFRFGVPSQGQLEFFGNEKSERLFQGALATLRSMGGEAVEIDLEPFLAAARLLYEGPWVAERYAAIEEFIQDHAEALYPTTRAIIEPAVKASAVEAFKAQYRLQACKRKADEQLDRVDFIVTPTAGTIYTIAQVNDNPIQLNSKLGYYTNFMNLLDYAAIALPSGFQHNGLPLGITLFAPAFHDRSLLAYAQRYSQRLQLPMGATGHHWRARSEAPLPDGQIKLAVCGAHMSGLPLNHQLTERGALPLARTTTSAHYRLYALPDGKRPGLIRDEDRGAEIELEVWQIPAQRFGDFVAQIPAPLGIGTVELSDGSTVNGFICESYAARQATEITEYGGWRRYISQA